MLDYTTNYADDYGHGTLMAGIIAAQDNNIGVVGVAPQAELYAVKILYGYNGPDPDDNAGDCAYSDIINGINWSIQNKMQVINLSVGGAVYSKCLGQAVQRAIDAGITVVAAAGNEYSADQGNIDDIDYPAAYPGVISVGAVDVNNQVADYSNRGAELTVVAPGGWLGPNGEMTSDYLIQSTFNDGGYELDAGTSHATAHVTGEVADMLSYNPQLTPEQIKAMVMATATPLGPQTSYGAGLINVAKAVQDVQKQMTQ